MSAWTERGIAAYLARYIFNRKCLVVLPNCLWAGAEADLFAVTNNLRIIDVEIKISRSDLKSDAKKDKWFHSWDWKIDGPYLEQGTERQRRPRQWPHRVWKHYYCLPEKIWMAELTEIINPASGVILIGRTPKGDGFYLRVERRAKPCRDAEKLDAEDAIDIARLASLRMWDAYDELRKEKP